MILAIFRLGLCFGHFGSNLAGMIKKLPSGYFEKFIQLPNPISHGHWSALQSLQFGEFNIKIHNPIEGVNLLFR